MGKTACIGSKLGDIMNNLLEIKDLSVSFGADELKQTQVIEHLHLTVGRGESLGVVGESGSGKSVTSLSIMGLLQKDKSQVKGNIYFDDMDLMALSEKEMQSIRGNRISMIFQEPMTSLNPTKTCGAQIMEPMLLHDRISKQEAKERAIKLLDFCGIPSPEQRFNEYPHQMSGGMRQRVMIAIALSCKPDLLIADEPTTALDVTIQAQILELLKRMKRQLNMSIMMITHDLGIVYDLCERVIIMYTGQIMEVGGTNDVFNHPLHPYTQGLIDAIPSPESDRNIELKTIEGTVPDSNKMPKGCRFHPRCSKAFDRCKEEVPQLVSCGDNRQVRCFLYDNGVSEHV